MMRPSWDSYFIGLAQQVATRATCPRAQVGSVLVSNKRVLGTGYNGSPVGTPHCTDEGCAMVGGHCIRTIHAEVNAVLDALQRGTVEGSTIYCTHFPCVQCTKLLKQVGVSEIVYAGNYRVPLGETELLHALDLTARKWNPDAQG